MSINQKIELIRELQFKRTQLQYQIRQIRQIGNSWIVRQRIKKLKAERFALKVQILGLSDQIDAALDTVKL